MFRFVNLVMLVNEGRQQLSTHEADCTHATLEGQLRRSQGVKGAQRLLVGPRQVGKPCCFCKISRPPNWPDHARFPPDLQGLRC